MPETHDRTLPQESERQHMSFPKGVLPPDRWNGPSYRSPVKLPCIPWQQDASYRPSPCRLDIPCRPGPCQLDELYHPRPGKLAFLTTHSENSPVRPRIVTVVRPGGEGGGQLRKITILLNRRAVQTFEQLVADISEALGLPRWRNDRIRRLFSLRGSEICSISSFFRSDDVFVAAAKEQPSLGQVQEVLEEVFPESTCFHDAVLQAWERTLRPSIKASKTDSGFHEELESDRVEKTSNQRNGNERLKDGAEQDGREKVRKWEWLKPEGRQHGQLRLRNSISKSEKVNVCVEQPRATCCRDWRRAAPLKKLPALIRGQEAQHAVDIREAETNRCRDARAKKHKRTGMKAEGTSRLGKGQSGGENNHGQSEGHGHRLLFVERRDEVHGQTADGGAGLAKRLVPLETDDRNQVQKSNEHELTIPPADEKASMLPTLLSGQGSKQGSLHGIEDPPGKDKGAGDPEMGMWPESGLLDPLSATNIVAQEDIERRYEIGRVIGDGNFATVRECRVRSAGKGAPPLAMKIISRAKLSGKEHMLQNEVSIAHGLSHPNVVRLLRHHETAEHIFLLMELIQGGDLFDSITKNGKFSEDCTAHMVQDLCQALEYIHAKSIVHRDLKPENLLVQRNIDGSTTLKLADFGLATVVTEPIFTVCGTPTYVAPEILAEKGYGLPVDMWATGVIVYILLCGFPPFRSQEKDQEELFQLIQQGVYEFVSPYWDGISQGAKAFTSEMLLVDSQKRLTASKALQHPWLQARSQSVCQGHPVTKE